MTTPDAATLADSIDLSTVAGWNLRALLLRLVARDVDIGHGAWSAESKAEAGALENELAYQDAFSEVTITPLGREVAERLRPEPWRACPTNVTFYQGVSMGELFGPDGESEAEINDERLATRIAALLTADDLRAAKAYRAETGS